MSGVLVTGASGLIGGRVARLLLPEREIFAAGRAVAGLSGLDDRHRISLDLSGEWNPSQLPANLDAVVHLAQSDNYRNFPDAAESILRVNTVSTVRLLDHALRAGAKTFVLASTGGVYGNGPRPFVEEDHLPLDDARHSSGSLDFYLRTRRAAECLAFAYAPSLAVVVLRFFFVYGPGQKPAMLIPRLLQCVRDEAPIALQGPDGLRMNPTHVDDAARAVRSALALGRSEVVNVAGPEVHTLRQIGAGIGRFLGKEPVFSVDRSAPPADLMGDIAKMSRLLGPPSVRFEDGLRTLQ